MAANPLEPPTSREPQYLAVTVEGEEGHPPLQEVSSFIYDFNLVYEISRLASDPNYQGYKFNRFIWNRDGRRLKDSDRLHLVSLELGSPFLLETAVLLVGGAVAAVWGLVQISERIADWPVNREKNRLELEKLRRELNPGDQAQELPKMLEERGAPEYYERSIRRVAENEIKITDIRLSIEPRFPSRRR
jgi:hypothetical protein